MDETQSTNWKIANAEFEFGNLKGRDYLGDLVVNGRIILKLNLWK